MLRIGIVGCGKIADSHAAQIQRIRGCELVGVCDPEPIMAQQLAERFAIKDYYTDLEAFLETARPDVVHITTPPQSHLPIGLSCLESGAHILVEKPFTIDTKDAQILIDAANRAGRKVTVGHDGQFSPVARDMRRLIQEGYIGAPPVHMESYWCYDLTDPTYAKALLADTHHWARQLPGGLPHNIINHGVSKIAEFIEADTPRVLAHGFVSPFLRSLGATDMIDELRVIVAEERGTTAYFTFSTQMRPSLHQFSIFGHENGITIDEDRRTLIKLSGTGLKSYAEHFLQPMFYAGQYVGNSLRNVGRFMKNEFHMDDGKYRLFSLFYDSVLNGTPVPIPYREIILTSYIMDQIFAQVSPLTGRVAGGNHATA
jgi:predicted dehydrogenase